MKLIINNADSFLKINGTMMMKKTESISFAFNVTLFFFSSSFFFFPFCLLLLRMMLLFTLKALI